MTCTGVLRGMLTALSIAVSVAGCAYVTGTRSPPQPDRPCCGGGPDDLRATYLGTGGWILEWDGQMVLGAPFFSHQSLPRVAFGRIRSDTVLVDSLLPSVDAARAILVGHGHHDHLLDVPWIARARAPDAWILGNRTVANILAGDPELPGSRVLTVTDSAGTAYREGRWVTLPGGRVRILPLLTEHAPHLQGVEVFEGTVDRPMERLPDRARDWMGGQGLAYLIDFLDRSGQVRYRVHYADISASAPWGYPPASVDGRARPVDLVILCAPSVHETEWFPEGLLDALRPRYALAGHWEDFFHAWSREPRSVKGTDLGVFVDRMRRALPEGSGWAVPRPLDTVYVRPAGR